MRTKRFYLLLGLLVLVGLALTGCLGEQSNVPKAMFTASTQQKIVPFTASFDGTLSYAPKGKIVSYNWTFGDGGGATGPHATHEYKSNGTYVVQLTVIDAQGVSNSSTMTVQALDPPPVATFTYSPKSVMNGEYVVGASEWITFDGSDSTDDGQIVSYDWNFGDGETAAGQVVKHRYLWPGTYNVVLTVTDNSGGKTQHVESVDILGGPPCNADLTGGGPVWHVGGGDS